MLFCTCVSKGVTCGIVLGIICPDSPSTCNSWSDRGNMLIGLMLINAAPYIVAKLAGKDISIVVNSIQIMTNEKVSNTLGFFQAIKNGAIISVNKMAIDNSKHDQT